MILNLLVQTCISIKKLIFNLLVKNSEQENLIHGTYICPFDIKTFILICWFGVRYHLKCWVFKSISLKDKLIFIKFSFTLIVFSNHLKNTELIKHCDEFQNVFTYPRTVFSLYSKNVLCPSRKWWMSSTNVLCTTNKMIFFLIYFFLSLNNFLQRKW